VTTAISWAGAVLAGGGVLLGLAVCLIALRPVVDQRLSEEAAAVLLAAAILLTIGLPGWYAAQADASGTVGLVGHALLAAGLLLLVVYAAPPLLHPTLTDPPGEGVILFGLGICLTVGLHLLGLATIQAGVLPAAAGGLILAATAGFFFAFFVAEFLPPAAGQIGSALFGILLAGGLTWIGASLWLRS
jgi:hypothetical protein